MGLWNFSNKFVHANKYDTGVLKQWNMLTDANCWFGFKSLKMLYLNAFNYIKLKACVCKKGNFIALLEDGKLETLIMR